MFFFIRLVNEMQKFASIYALSQREYMDGVRISKTVSVIFTLLVLAGIGWIISWFI